MILAIKEEEEVAHGRVGTRARHPTTQIKPTEQILTFKNRTFYGNRVTAHKAHDSSHGYFRCKPYP